MVRCRSPFSLLLCCFFSGTKHNKRLSAFYCTCRFMRLTEVNRKNLYLWRSGDLCLQSTMYKFHFIVLIKSPFVRIKMKNQTLRGYIVIYVLCTSEVGNLIFSQKCHTERIHLNNSHRLLIALVLLLFNLAHRKREIGD